MNFTQVESLEEMENGETYSYGKSIEDQQVFIFQNDDYRDCVELQYNDGYVGEPSVENFKRHISEGKVYKHE